MSVLTADIHDNGLFDGSQTHSVTPLPHERCNTSGLPIQMLYSEQLARIVVIYWFACGVPTFNLAQAQWRTGDAFHQGLERKISLVWDANPIRDALHRLAQSQSIAIYLDRRIDPGAPLSVEIDDSGMSTALRHIARQRNVGIGFVGPVVYVGPRMAAARVATLAEMREDEARNYSPELRANLLAKQPLTWPKLTEPQWLLRKLGAEGSLTPVDLESIPHDLWPPVDLPEMSLCERLTLVLANFGMTYKLDPETREMAFVGIPRAVAVERTYAVNQAVDATVDELELKFPQALVERQGTRLRVRSTSEDQWAISRLLTAKPLTQSADTSPALQRFTLTVKEQPFGTIARQIGARVEMQVDFGPNAQAKLEQRIAFSVQQATLEDLFDALAESAGLRATIHDGRVQFD